MPNSKLIAAQVARRLNDVVNPFAYMLTPATVAELVSLGIDFTSLNTCGHFKVEEVGQNDWPMLILPSGQCLSISQNDEGNGRGATLEDTAPLPPSLCIGP